jgi:hypothetical protein
MAIKNTKRGFTIFFAVLVGGLALAVGLAIYDLTVRELDLSSSSTQSQYAIYAADTGAECALYWDFECPVSGGPVYCTRSGGSAFSTSSSAEEPSGSGLTCSGVDITTGWSVTETPTSATTRFTLTFLPQQYCTDVYVVKTGTPTVTTVTAHGYNTCQTGALNRFERVLEINY